MERLIMKDLLLWKNSKYRKPLILKGVRQVGKTWVLKEFGKQHYENVAYFNFDMNQEYHQFFETTKDIRRIIQNLTFATGQKILPEKTLIIFDEVQDCPNVISSMKYFCEEGPEYHIACAGSLLGIALARPSSFPVGKVDFLEINPMNFTEFLMANGDGNMVDYLNLIQSLEPIPDAFFNLLYERLKMYYVTGGMPEVVKRWVEEKDIEAMEQALLNIINAYERDFAKYPERREHPKISMIWKSIPSQLARENKKFLYNTVKNGVRAREYEDALQWLVNAELVRKIYRSSQPGLPIAAYDDLSAFKIYIVDVGILRRLALLSPSAFSEGNRLFVEFKGALSENYVLQALKNQFEATPRYWSENNPSYEVDFLIQRENEIFPVEVKSEDNIESKSLKKYKEKYKDRVKLRVRFSSGNLKLDDDMLNIPLFMADFTDKLIGMALKKEKWYDLIFDKCKEQIGKSTRYLYKEVKMKKNEYDEVWQLVTMADVRGLLDESWAYFLPVKRKSLIDIYEKQTEIVILQDIELFGFKIKALLERTAARDLYDVFNMIDVELFKREELNLLRKSVLFYIALAQNKSRTYSPEKIDKIDFMQIKAELLPVLQRGTYFELDTIKKTVKEFITNLMQLTVEEEKFLSEFKTGNYFPELLFSDEKILERIKKHPMALWRVGNGQESNREWIFESHF